MPYAPTSVRTIKPVQSRASAAKRGYDHLWRAFRLAFLNQHPLCSDCQAQGFITASQEVHHLKKLADGGPRLDPSNCLALCQSCHSIRTKRGE